MRFIFFIFFLAQYWVLSAQTLQFSRILLVDAQVATVPNGAVWKVNSLVPNSAHSSGSSPSVYSIVLNGQSSPLGHSGFGTSTSANSFALSSMQAQTLPMWLPSGTTLAAGSGTRVLSVTEFLVIP
jgi:hypothetical protein